MIKKLNFPNIITLTRLLIIPIFVLFFYIKIRYHFLICALLFIYAALTDYIDGFLARRYSLVSTFGEFIDPVADKLVVVTALLMLITTYTQFYVFIPVSIIILREILVSALREWMASLEQRKIVSVSLIAKVKTGMQMGAIILLLLSLEQLSPVFFPLGIICLYLSAILALVSMCFYFQSAWPYLGLKGQDN